MIVLDSSALVELVADGPDKAWVGGRMSDHPVAAPAHQLAEVASAVGRLVRAGDLRPEDGLQALTDAARLPQDVHPVDERLLQEAYDMRDRVRILDGIYVALARRLGATLLTTDRRLRPADPPCPVEVPPDNTA